MTAPGEIFLAEIRDQPRALTICILTVENGFTFIGKSAAASPANYNEDIGDKIAYEDAFRQIWSHEGYLLKEKLFRGQS